MTRSKSSGQWLERHFKDPYVKKAQEGGWRSRAAFKLLELQEKDQLLKPGMTVVDLGAAPGGWSQAASRLMHDDCQIFALDILPMDPLPNVTFIQGDFQEDEVMQALLDQVEAGAVDLVLSDMAPNLTGQKNIDQPRSIYLAELALDFADKTLKPGGTMAVKVFQGEGFNEYLDAMKSHFQKVLTRKPDASRGKSREVYLIGKNYQ